MSRLDGVVVAMNPAMQLMIGLEAGSPSEGLNLLALLDPPDQMCDLLDVLFDSGALRDYALAFNAGDGIRNVRVTGTILPASLTSPESFVATARPASPHRWAPDASEGETGEAAAKRVASLIAHDLNNALGPVSGYCHFLKRLLVRSADGLTDLDGIERACGEATLIVRQLAALGGSRVVGAADLDPIAELERLEPSIRALYPPEVPVDFTWQGSRVAMAIDPGVFADVVMSLAIEARSGLPADASVRMGCATTDDGRSWQVGVVMTTRSGARFSRRSLAWAALEAWVAMSGGSILSEEGEGGNWSARVTFPCVPLRASTGESPASADSAPTSVLVVDDNPALRLVGQRVLTEHGYDVTVADSGQAAIALLERRPFDVVITDIVMPGASGWNVGRAARARYSSCRVVYVSGDLDQAMNASEQVDDALFLLKPFTPVTLIERVASACRTRH